ncbi:MAG TPA: TlpA disulfide reductase family protein [Thermoanaerobaculia bacterium]
MRRAVPAACLMFAALSLSLAAGAARQEAQPISDELALNAVDGRTVDFGELRGEVVLLDFWATWCKPCLEATPHLERLHRRMEGKPFVLVGINADGDRERLEAYLAEEGLPWPQIWDGSYRVSDAFGVDSWPTYLVIDHEGRPVSKLTGWGSEHGRMLDREVGRHVARAQRAVRRAEREAAGR